MTEKEKNIFLVIFNFGDSSWNPEVKLTQVEQKKKKKKKKWNMSVMAVISS